MNFDIEKKEVVEMIKEYYSNEYNCDVKNVTFCLENGALKIYVRSDISIGGIIREVNDTINREDLEKIIISKLSDDIKISDIKMNLSVPNRGDTNLSPTLSSITISIDKIIKQAPINKR